MLLSKSLLVFAVVLAVAEGTSSTPRGGDEGDEDTGANSKALAKQGKKGSKGGVFDCFKGRCGKKSCCGCDDCFNSLKSKAKSYCKSCKGKDCFGSCRGCCSSRPTARTAGKATLGAGTIALAVGLCTCYFSAELSPVLGQLLGGDWDLAATCATVGGKYLCSVVGGC